MSTQWKIQGRGHTNCSCAYGCPCQFNALPTNGSCHAVITVDVQKGFHGSTNLDGLKGAIIVSWPGPIHFGKGQMVPIVEDRATPAQRDGLVRILSGQDTNPGATIFQVFSTTYDKVHAPVFAKVDLSIDVDARKAQIQVPGVVEGRGEPILNPVTGQEHRIRIDLPHGFEYALAEIGRGWSTTKGPIALNLQDSHAHFINLHMTESGVVH